MAHFLGADDASKLIAAASSRPETSAAGLFPAAAAANRSIFFDGARPRSVAEVYGRLDIPCSARLTGSSLPGSGQHHVF
jgi:hypothetical protein